MEKERCFACIFSNEEENEGKEYLYCEVLDAYTESDGWCDYYE